MIIWAYVGIAAKQDPLSTVAAALLGAVVVAAITGYVLLRPRTGERHQAASSA